MRGLAKRARSIGGRFLGPSAKEGLRKTKRMILSRFLAPGFRRLVLRRVTFIGVTGSAGKTTTKELVAAVLMTSFKGQKTVRNLNLPWNIVASVLRTKPSDDFFVAEIAAAIRGRRVRLEEPLRLLRPQIGVVTTVGMEHVRAFSSLEDIAAEKGKLVAMLPPEGTAVLNADDSRVLAMQARFSGQRVLTYGTARSASVRADDIRGTWPDRLSFTVTYEGRSYPVHTQLCGTHFVPCVLAALAVGVAMGVPLAKAAEAVNAVPPFPGRMSPVTSPDDVTFIRDDVKAPLWSLPLSFQFMKDARAQRKLIVLGTLSDYVGESSSKYVAVAKQALEAADIVMFVGPNASKCLKAKSHPKGGALHAISSTETAREHLQRMLRPGDLVLLKGSEMDRLGHLTDARVVPVAEQVTQDDGRSFIAGTAGSRIRIIVGLGNPGVTHENTPHNVGQRALDLLAKSLDASFEPDDEAVVALINLPTTKCYLVKPLTLMNATGPVIARLAKRVGAEAQDCILIHDDIDLPVGTIRTRMSGGDGGHRGVRSVLQGFQSDGVCRVKIGVGRPKRPGAAASHVTTRFDPAEAAMIARACSDAAVRVRELAGMAGVAHGRG